MNILYYYPNYDTIMFQWQKKHIFDEMYKHNCYFSIISPLDFDSIELANQAIIEHLKKNKIDIFMTSYSTDFLFLETLDAIKKMDVRTLLFCPDNLVVPYNQRKIAKYFDLVWLTSHETKYLFDRWGANSIVLPYAANPNLFDNEIIKNDIGRLAFIGTPHGSRVERIEMLLNSGVPMTIFSKQSDTNNSNFRASFRDYLSVGLTYLKFPIGRKLLLASIIDKLGRHEINLNNKNLQLESPVPLEQLGSINSNYALTLAFTEANSTGVLNKPVPVVNLRNFEIPMSGGLEIAMYTDELASYFEDGKEIVLAHTKEELVEKAKFYIKEENQDLRYNMKMNARRRAINDHTWFNRFEKIFNEFGVENYI